MREMKCPRCGEAIPIAEGTLLVRCPSCFAEFKVNRPSPMGEAVTRFREQAQQHGEQAPRPRPAEAKPEVAEPATAPAAEPVAVRPPPPAYTPAPPTYRPARPLTRNPLMARQQRRAIWGILALVLILFAGVGTGLALLVYHRWGPIVILRGDEDGEREGAGAKRPRRRPTGRADDQPAPPSHETHVAGPPPVQPPPGTTKTQPPRLQPANLDISINGNFRANENDPTIGWFRGIVQSHEQKAILRAVVRAHFYDATGKEIWRESFEIRMIPPGEAIPFSVDLQGVRISDIDAGKTRFDLEIVKWAAEDARMLPVPERTVRFIEGPEPMDDHKVVGRVNNDLSGPVFDVRIWVEIYDRSGRQIARDDALVNSGAVIRPTLGEDFSVTIPSVLVMAPERIEKIVVRAMGRHSGADTP